MDSKEIELTEVQLLADIHNMLSDIHEAMFAEEEIEGEEAEGSEIEGEEAEGSEIEGEEAEGSEIEDDLDEDN